MYGQPTMTCFIYQVYLYGWSQREHYESSNCAHPSTTGKGETRMVEEPSHAKQIFLNHMCKIKVKVEWYEIVASAPF
jgi:hypothetical protein